VHDATGEARAAYELGIVACAEHLDGLRRADGTRVDVDLAAILANVDAGTNAGLADGDTLYVPSLNVGEVAVLGAVRSPSRYAVGRGERVSALILCNTKAGADNDEARANRLRSA
jgi:protein involved in polysaccharide export with SLBB domain